MSGASEERFLSLLKFSFIHFMVMNIMYINTVGKFGSI